MIELLLGPKQRLFTQLVGQLILWTYEQGYELSLGEAWRTPEQAALNAKRGIGIVNSLHCDRLAIDLNLFINGFYVTDANAYKPLGAYWKTLHPLCRWGGDWGDSVHFSVEHGGRK